MKLCSIASGSSGNCIFAGSETTSLLIDAGISGKRVEAGLAVLDRSAKELDGILVTHEHSDHIQGLGVLARRYGIPIYATDGTIQAMQQTKSLGKFPEGIFHTIHADDTFTLGDIAVHPFTISHDAAEPVGYRMESGGKSIAIATDLGVYSDYTVQNLTGLDAVLLEANHDENMLAVGPYPYPLKQRIAGAKGHAVGQRERLTDTRLLRGIAREDDPLRQEGHFGQSGAIYPFRGGASPEIGASHHGTGEIYGAVDAAGARRPLLQRLHIVFIRHGTAPVGQFYRYVSFASLGRGVKFEDTPVDHIRHALQLLAEAVAITNIAGPQPCLIGGGHHHTRGMPPTKHPRRVGEA